MREEGSADITYKQVSKQNYGNALEAYSGDLQE